MEIVIPILMFVLGFWIFLQLIKILWALFVGLLRLWFYGSLAALGLLLIFGISQTVVSHPATSAPAQSAPSSSDAVSSGVVVAQEEIQQPSQQSIQLARGATIAALLMLLAAPVIQILLEKRKRRKNNPDALPLSLEAPKPKEPRLIGQSENKDNKLLIPVASKVASVPVRVLELGAFDHEFMDNLKLQYPWIVVRVPPRFSDAFLFECDWLRQRIQKNPSLEDQSSILKSVSKGYTWNSE